MKANVGLFVTCLVNTLRPSVGFAAIQLLEDADCNVSVPSAQSCCGQPAFNSGDDEGTKAIARKLIERFEGFDYVVAPSGSCAAMIRKFDELFENDDPFAERAKSLAGKTFELLSFLVDICDYTVVDSTLDATYSYHHSCSGLRELNVHQQPMKLLKDIKGLQAKPLKGSTECCGFGGTFCVKYSDISNEVVSEKVDNILAANADILLGGDLGCLMNIEGKMNRVTDKEAREKPTSVMHTAELLADLLPSNDS